MRNIGLVAAPLFCVLFSVSCGFWFLAGPFTVTYHGNGNTSGAVPEAETEVFEEDLVYVEDNYGRLGREGFLFAGWTTRSDGGGSLYIPGESFTMDNDDVDLYARWVTSEFEFDEATGTIELYNFWDTAVAIPDAIRGSPVRAIGEAAFRGRRILAVTIPSSVRSIGMDAFRGNKLSTVIIPDSVTSLGSHAFMDNDLETAALPAGLAAVPPWLFRENELRSVAIPPSVVVIGDHAFSRNYLSEIDIPPSVSTIEDGAFSSNALSTLTIPATVTSVGGYAFFDNYLTSIVIPNSISVIRDSAFRENNLWVVTLSPSVRRIEDRAFLDNDIDTITIGAGVSILQEEEDPMTGSTMGSYGYYFLRDYAAGGKSAGTYEYTGGAWELR